MRNFLENRTEITAAAKAKSVEKPSQEAKVLPHIPHAFSSIHPAAATAEDFPKVELKHDTQGRIREILITCRCGEQITLQCAY